MTREEYLQLFEKYLAGQATPAQIDRLMAYGDEFRLAAPSAGVPDAEQEVIGARIFEQVRRHTGTTFAQRSRRQWWAAAAVVAVLITAGFFYRFSPASRQQLAVKPAAQGAGIVPGSSKATLTLADGRRIILNDAGNGTILRNSHLLITKEKNGLLRYAATAAGDPATAGLNTLSTPRGGEYQLVLPDGTRVWLNAASTLSFPAAFTGPERTVTLTGEGYFEVAKNRHKPFKVKFRDQEVEVLGTHFDIMAYPDDAAAKTTLMEGSVKISRQQQRQILHPGQQAVSTEAGSGFQVAQVDLREVMAWKDGFLAFRNTTIQSIMKQAARWYDVEVVYQDDLNGQIFGGRISKYSDISELLHNLELTGTIHFKREGRRVTVMP